MTISRLEPDGGNFSLEATVLGHGIGAKRTKLGFNPSDNPRIRTVKTLCALLIDEIAGYQASALDAEAKRAMATAQTMIESGQMFAVKGIAHDMEQDQ